MPDDIITIETDYDFKATISCGKSKFNIIGKSAEEFPFLPKIEKNDAITISQFSLKEIITQTVFSVSPDENNKIMTGELIEINDDNLKIASLDGHRISLRKIKLLKSYEPVKVIVPGKALTELSRILSDDIEKNVSVYLTNKHILFEFDNTILLSRLIEGKYYNIDVMISNDYETKITINKNELLGCIDRASLLIRESEKKPIVFNIGAENLEIKRITNSGTMNEDLSIVREGADMVIGFNPKFIMDVLRVIDDEYIDFYMMDFKSPVCIKDKDGNYIYLVLPINIAN
jgi:DNA polymerase-3 subunit beta